MSHFLDHEVDFFKSCRLVTVTLEGKNDPVDKTLQIKLHCHIQEDIPAKIKQKCDFYGKGQKFKLTQFLHTSRPQ